MTNPSNGLFAPPRDWDALKRAYEQNTGSLADLAAANHIQLKTLRGYIKLKGWALPEAAATTPVTPRAGPPNRPVAKSETAARKAIDLKARRVAEPEKLLASLQADALRQALLSRLYKALMRKLEQVENSMEADTPLSPADDERQMRSLGTLAKTLETVDELSAADHNDASRRAGAGKPLAAPETASNDDDKLRRELAARIKRLRERLTR